MSATSHGPGFRGAVAVVPTRNRPDLAKNAIGSLLDSGRSDLRILVSDNSTSAADAEALAAHCAQLDGRLVAYVRPPTPMPMTDHWQWALDEAMARYADATHFMFLTDRMMFREGGLAEVLSLARAYPDKLIAYNHDRVVDDRRPIRVQEYAATGQLLELETSHVIWLYSQCFLFNAFPRMLNTIVPRRVLKAIRAHFGSVFASIAPDLAFCCRVLHVEETYLFYDKSVMFHYALDRSHGATVARGDVNPDAADFARDLAVDPTLRNYATPLPGLMTAHNAVMNEYLIHRQATGDPRFGPIEMARYLDINAWEVTSMTNAKVRSQMITLLRAAGYEGPTNDVGADESSGDDATDAPHFDDVATAIDWARSHVTGGAGATRTFHEMLQGRPLPLTPD